MDQSLNICKMAGSLFRQDEGGTVISAAPLTRLSDVSQASAFPPKQASSYRQLKQCINAACCKGEIPVAFDGRICRSSGSCLGK